MSAKDKICVPLFGPTAESLIGTIEEVQKVYPFVELRLDSLGEPESSALSAIRRACTVPCIATCRLPEDGGLFHGSAEQRASILRQCFELGFDLVDIEIEQADSLGFDVREFSSQLLLSHHNFDLTPEDEALDEIVAKMLEFQPSVCKFSTQVRKDSDCGRLFKLLCTYSNDCKMIVIGMGPRGRMTRIIGPLLGSVASFSEPVGAGTPRALGQISAKRMREIFDAIEGAS